LSRFPLATLRERQEPSRLYTQPEAREGAKIMSKLTTSEATKRRAASVRKTKAAKRRKTQEPEPPLMALDLPTRNITRAQALALVGVSHMTFSKMIAEGKMPRPRKLGPATYRWNLGEVLEALDRLPRGYNPAPTSGPALSLVR
jgi:predicted DNA-binding transcriptional regulator AlpA